MHIIILPFFVANFRHLPNSGKKNLNKTDPLRLDNDEFQQKLRVSMKVFVDAEISVNFL